LLPSPLSLPLLSLYLLICLSPSYQSIYLPLLGEDLGPEDWRVPEELSEIRVWRFRRCGVEAAVLKYTARLCRRL